MKKIIPFILVFAMVFGFVGFYPSDHLALAADASLLVSGQTLMNTAFSAVIASIAADPTGLTENIKAMADDLSISALGVLSLLLGDYSQRYNIPISSINQLFSTGVLYAASGALALNDELSSFLSDFFGWAYDEDGGNLAFYDPPSLGSESSIDYSGVDTSTLGFTYTADIIVSNEAYLVNRAGTATRRYVPSGSSTVYCCMVGTYIPWFFSLESFTVNRYDNNVSTPSVYTASQYTAYGLTYFFVAGSSFSSDASIHTPTSSTNGNRDQTAYMIFSGTLTGGANPNIDTNVFDFPDDNYDTNILDPDSVFYVPDFGGVGQFTANPQSYYEGVSDVIYTGSGTISVTDEAGNDSTIELERTGTAGIELTQTNTGSLESVIGGTVSNVSSGTNSDTIGAFSLDLRNYFPFCIPFDIYDMLSLFAGSAEAPYIEYPFVVPGIVDETIVIDLSVFDSVASVFRNMQIIAFSLFLAWNSKKLLFGS